MYLINNQPWIDLDPYVDTLRLRSYFTQFCCAIGKNYTNMMAGTHGANCLYDNKYPDLGSILNDIRSNKVKMPISTEGLTERELRLFCLYYFDIVSMNYNLILRGYKSHSTKFVQKHLPSMIKDYPASKDFGFFWKWLDDQRIFESYGRTVLFLSEPKEDVDTMLSNHVHADYPDRISRRDQFIWINFSPDKKFFVLNADNNERSYITSTVSVFDGSNWHGVKEPTRACFSLRVDGTFSKEFLERANLLEHYKHEGN